MPDQNHADSQGRVVDLRGAALKRGWRAQKNRAQETNDNDEDGLKKFEQSKDPDDDYRQRMITNGLALAFLIFLVGAGIWIADTMATMRKSQDCVLSGRRGCTPVEAPPSQRW